MGPPRWEAAASSTTGATAPLWPLNATTGPPKQSGNHKRGFSFEFEKIFSAVWQAKRVRAVGLPPVVKGVGGRGHVGNPQGCPACPSPTPACPRAAQACSLCCKLPKAWLCKRHKSKFFQISRIFSKKMNIDSNLRRLLKLTNSAKNCTAQCKKLHCAVQ